MALVKFFRTNGGTGDASYSSNSGFQRMGIMRTKGLIEQAVSNLCQSGINTLVMADLGCSSGPNTLLVGSMVIDAVAKTSLEMGLNPPEVQINFSDLPNNDFNTIFIALQDFHVSINKDVHHQLACYFTGVPGSFYGRLFPMKSLNFVHSSYSLQYLSQVPVLEEINKGNVYLSSTTPESVCRAYFEQFQKDFLRFLKCRSEEVMAGGRMVLTIGGRTTEDPRDEKNNLSGPLAMALQDMVLEGLIEEEKLDSFNVPIFLASPTEISNLVKMEGSFAIEHLEIFHDVSLEAWRRTNNDNNASQLKETKDGGVGHNVAKVMRAGMGSLVANHFGEAIVDDFFMRYGQILTKRSSESWDLASITVSLTRKM